MSTNGADIAEAYPTPASTHITQQQLSPTQCTLLSSTTGARCNEQQFRMKRSFFRRHCTCFASLCVCVCVFYIDKIACVLFAISSVNACNLMYVSWLVGSFVQSFIVLCNHLPFISYAESYYPISIDVSPTFTLMI